VRSIAADIAAKDFGAKWPFTVAAGELRCVGPGSNVVFVVGGATYALNDTAKTYAREAKMGWKPLDAIWRDDPVTKGTKVSTGDMIAKGLTLCGKAG
jgi:hypothetical protein